MNKREDIKFNAQLRKNMKKYDIQAEKDMRAGFLSQIRITLPTSGGINGINVVGFIGGGIYL